MLAGLCLDSYLPLGTSVSRGFFYKAKPSQAGIWLGFFMTSIVLRALEIIAMVIMKLLDPDQKLRLWGRVLPWVFIVCLVMVAASFSWSLVK